MKPLLRSPVRSRRNLFLAASLSLFLYPLFAAEDPDYLLGVRFFQAGQFQPAAKQFERVIQLYPDHLDARYSLGKIAFLQERYVAAFQFLRDCLAINPEYKDAKALFRQSLDQINSRFSGTFSNPEVVSALTAHHFESDNLIEAKRGIEFLVKKYPDFPFGWDHLAEYYQRLKSLDRALAAAKKALALAPSSPTVFHNYQKIYYLKFHKKLPRTLSSPNQSESQSGTVQNLIDETILASSTNPSSPGASGNQANPALASTPLEEEANSSLFEKLLKKETEALPPPEPVKEKPKPKEAKPVYVPPPQPTRDLQAEQRLLEERARKALEEKNWELAATSFAILYNNNPTREEFKESFERARRYDRFEQEFQSALRTLKRGARDPAQFKKAKELFLQLDSVTYSEIHQKQSFDEYLAYIAFSLKNYTEAEKICKNWIRQEPQSFQAHYLLLKSLESQGKYSESYFALNKCSQIDSAALNAKPGILRLKWKAYLYHYWWLLALFVFTWFLITLGYTTYKFSIRQKKQKWKGRFDKVRELAADKEWAAMIRAIDKLLLAELSSSELYNLMYLKANGLFQSNRVDEARKQCHAILTKHSKDQQTLVLLGRVYLALQEVSQDTIEAYRLLTTKEPTNPDALKIYLKALKAAGIYDEETEKIALKILDIESYEQEILKDLVEIYGHRQTRNEQSCEVLKRYVELHPQDSGVLHLYLQNLVAIGNYIEAIRIGHRLIPINPEIEEAHQALIRAYDELNMSDELRSFYHDLSLEMPHSRVVEKMFSLIQNSAGTARTKDPASSGIQDSEITQLALDEGKKLLKNGSYHEAILKLQTASQEKDLLFEAKILMIRCYLRLGDMDAVFLNFQTLNLKEQRLNHDAMEVVYDIAVHHEEQKEIKKALQLLQIIARNDVTFKDTFQKIELLSMEA